MGPSEFSNNGLLFIKVSKEMGGILKFQCVHNYIAITGSTSIQDTHLLGWRGGASNALKAGCTRHEVPAGTSCLVQPGPKPRALFLKSPHIQPYSTKRWLLNSNHQLWRLTDYRAFYVKEVYMYSKQQKCHLKSNPERWMSLKEVGHSSHILHDVRQSRGGDNTMDF